MQYMPHSLVGGRVATTGPVQIFGGTTNTDFAFAVFNAGNSAQFFEIFGNGSGTLGPTNVLGLSWNTAGGFTIATPTSGAPLAINAISLGTYLTFSDGTRSGNLACNGSGAIQFGTTTNHELDLYTNNATRVAIGNSGNVTIAAPASGVALSVNGFGASGVSALVVAGANVAGARGLSITAGTVGSTDIAFLVQDVNASHNLMLVQANGAFSAGPNSANSFVINSAGNVTIAAPTGGTALAITGATGAAGLTVTTGHSGLVDFDAAQLIMGPNAASSANGGQMRFRKDTGAQAWAIGLPESAAATTFFIFDLVNSREVLNIAPGGNVTIDAPASGTALTVNLVGVGAGDILFTGNVNTGVIGEIVNTSAGTAAYASWQVGNSAHGLDIDVTSTGFSGTVPGYTGGPSGEQAVIATGPTAVPLSIGTAGAERVRISGSGNVTINAPTSGTTTLTVNANATTNVGINVTASSNTTAQINVSNSGGGAATSANFDLNDGSTTASIGYQASTMTLGNSVTHGVAGNALTIGVVPASPILFYTNLTAWMQITGAGAIQGWGTTAAAFVDMTPDTGTFTITYTGMTTTVTGTAIWARHGNKVTLVLPAATGTSNSVNMTATGLPAAIQPTHAQTIVLAQGAIEDNTYLGPISPAGCSLAASSGTLTFTYNPVNGTFGGGGFTNSGTKGVGVATPISYVLN